MFVPLSLKLVVLLSSAISRSAVDSQFRYFCKFLHICLGFSLESIFSRISRHLLDIFPFLFDCYFGGGQHREIWTINLGVSGDVPVVNAKNWVIGTHDANDNDHDCAHRDDDADHDGVLTPILVDEVQGAEYSLR